MKGSKPKITYSDFKVGDYVELDSWSTIGQSALAQGSNAYKVTKIERRFHTKTGNPYKIMQLDDGAWYNYSDGAYISGGASAYYVVVKKQHHESKNSKGYKSDGKRNRKRL